MAITVNIKRRGKFPQQPELDSEFDNLIQQLNSKIGEISDVVNKDGEEPDGYDDFQIPATNIKINPAVSYPAFDYAEVGFSFRDAQSDYLIMSGQLPHRWKEGSDIYPHIHWIQALNLNVVWQLEYRWYNVGDNVPGSWTLHGTSLRQAKLYTSGSMHQITGFDKIRGEGKTISSLIDFKITRLGNDGSDNYTAAALFKGFDFHIIIDSFGSSEEYHK